MLGKLNFYGLEFNLKFPKTFDEFKQKVSELYSFTKNEVNELYFSLKNKGLKIIDGNTYKNILKFNNQTVNIEINEKSKIFKDELKNIKNEKEETKIVHLHYFCNGCNKGPIIGTRYKCTICNDFDYCEECEEKFSGQHLHPFIKIYKPEMKLASIQCIVDDKCPDYQNKK